MNQYEYGQVLYANLGQDVSSATAYQFVLQPKSGIPTNKNSTGTQPLNSIVRTGSDVTLGTSNVTVGDQKYLAHQYLQYTIKENDLSIAGIWRIKGIATVSATKEIVGDYQNVTVMA